MKIGDHVRDKGTEFVGTVVQLEPATGTAARVLIQADQSADKMWQKVEELELIDVEGKRVSGKAGQQLDAPDLSPATGLPLPETELTHVRVRAPDGTLTRWVGALYIPMGANVMQALELWVHDHPGYTIVTAP
jgi:hypothetical protein